MKLVELLTFGLLGLTQGHSKEQCPVVCTYSPAYEAFGDYLEGLSNCEKRDLLPIMTARYGYIVEAEKLFEDHEYPEALGEEIALDKLRKIYVAYKEELELLNEEFKKVQALLFNDCTSAESKEILAHHLSVLGSSIEEHSEKVEFLKQQIKDKYDHGEDN